MKTNVQKLTNTKINKNTPVLNGEHCVEWQGALQSSGYGIFPDENNRPGMKQRFHSPHRFVMGNPDGMEVHHQCRNKKCCNPAHLEITTHQGNMSYNKGMKYNKPTKDQLKYIHDNLGQKTQSQIAKDLNLPTHVIFYYAKKAKRK